MGAGAQGGTSRNGKCPQASTGLGCSQERHAGSHCSLTRKEQGRRIAEASQTRGAGGRCSVPTPTSTPTPCKPYVTFVLETLGGGTVNAEAQVECVASMSACVSLSPRAWGWPSQMAQFTAIWNSIGNSSGTPDLNLVHSPWGLTPL